MCTLTGQGMYSCGAFSSERWCGSDFDAWGNPRFINSFTPYGVPRMQVNFVSRPVHVLVFVCM